MKNAVPDRIEEMSIHAGDLLDQGYHCSEAVMQVVGDAYLQDYSSFLKRISNGFRGGVAKTHENMCGAFSASVMLLGAFGGRTSPQDDDEEFLLSVRNFKNDFVQCYGTVNCQELLDKKVADGEVNCRRYVETAVRLLLEYI